MKTLIATLLAAASLIGIAQAHEFKVGDLVIDHPWTKATLPNQPVAGGFMTITNNGDTPDRLVSTTASFAGEVQVHQMAVENDVMKMRQLPDGLEIPAHGTVELQPGGYHLMFMELDGPVKAGEMYKATLSFENAGSVEVEFKAEDMKAQAGDHGGEMGHGEMGHEGMEHGKNAQ